MRRLWEKPDAAGAVKTQLEVSDMAEILTPKSEENYAFWKLPQARGCRCMSSES